MSLAGIGPTRIVRFSELARLGFRGRLLRWRLDAPRLDRRIRKRSRRRDFRSRGHVESAVDLSSPFRIGLPADWIAPAGLRNLVASLRPYVISPAALTPVDGASYVAAVPPSPFAPVLVAASDVPGHEQRSGVSSVRRST
jgi:hypothetical protein